MSKKDEVTIDIDSNESNPRDLEVAVDTLADVAEVDIPKKDTRSSDFEATTDTENDDVVVDFPMDRRPTTEEINKMTMAEYIKWRNHPVESPLADERQADTNAKRLADDAQRAAIMEKLGNMTLTEYKKYVSERDKGKW